MYGLLNELANRGLGCHTGGVFAGYADDLKFLTPSVWHCIKWLVYAKGMHINLMFYLIQRRVK